MQARSSSIGSTFNIKTLGTIKEITENLPYQLTKDQKDTVNSRIQKVREGKRLNALVQGDVGCGKTIVAILMMAALAENGYQAVLMAPTQVPRKTALCRPMRNSGAGRLPHRVSQLQHESEGEEGCSGIHRNRRGEHHRRYAFRYWKERGI